MKGRKKEKKKFAYRDWIWGFMFEVNEMRSTHLWPVLLWHTFFTEAHSLNTFTFPHTIIYTNAEPVQK